MLRWIVVLIAFTACCEGAYLSTDFWFTNPDCLYSLPNDITETDWVLLDTCLPSETNSSLWQRFTCGSSEAQVATCEDSDCSVNCVTSNITLGCTSGNPHETISSTFVRCPVDSLPAEVRPGHVMLQRFQGSSCNPGLRTGWSEHVADDSFCDPELGGGMRFSCGSSQLGLPAFANKFNDSTECDATTFEGKEPLVDNQCFDFGPNSYLPVCGVDRFYVVESGSVTSGGCDAAPEERTYRPTGVCHPDGVGNYQIFWCFDTGIFAAIRCSDPQCFGPCQGGMLGYGCVGGSNITCDVLPSVIPGNHMRLEFYNGEGCQWQNVYGLQDSLANGDCLPRGASASARFDCSNQFAPLAELYSDGMCLNPAEYVNGTQCHRDNTTNPATSFNVTCASFVGPTIPRPTVAPTAFVPTEPPTEDKSISGGVIAGIIIGVLVGVALVAVAVWAFARKFGGGQPGAYADVDEDSLDMSMGTPR